MKWIIYSSFFSRSLITLPWKWNLSRSFFHETGDFWLVHQYCPHESGLRYKHHVYKEYTILKEIPNRKHAIRKQEENYPVVINILHKYSLCEGIARKSSREREGPEVMRNPEKHKSFGLRVFPPAVISFREITAEKFLSRHV